MILSGQYLAAIFQRLFFFRSFQSIFFFLNNYVRIFFFTASHNSWKNTFKYVTWLSKDQYREKILFSQVFKIIDVFFIWGHNMTLKWFWFLNIKFSYVYWIDFISRDSNWKSMNINKQVIAITVKYSLTLW